MRCTLLLASTLFVGTLALPQDRFSAKNHLEARFPEEDGDAGSEIGNDSGGGETPGDEEDAWKYPQIPPAQYQTVYNYGCGSLTEYAYMPQQKDGVVKSPGCANYGKMLNNWPMPNADGKVYDGSATDFDDSADCTLYLAWSQGNDYWIAFARDASNHPMGGIPAQNRSGLSPPGVFSLETGGWTMTVTEATGDFTPESPPDNSGLSFVWAQAGGDEGEVAWPSNAAVGVGNQGGCSYNVDPTKPQKFQGGMVGMRYWQCPFLYSVAHKQ